MSDERYPGSFGEVGPAVYLTDQPREAQAMLASGQPRGARWFHALDPENALSAARFGLIPSCWRGGDCCAVFGVAERSDVASYRSHCVLELESPVLSGQLKAWWVPPHAVRGLWLDGRRLSLSELAEMSHPSRPQARRCHCGLAGLVEREINAWRSCIGSW